MVEFLLYTYVPNYLQITSIAPTETSNTDGLTWIATEDATYAPQECLVENDEYRCWQKFIISTTYDECAAATELDPQTEYTFNNNFDLFSILSCSDPNDLNDGTSTCSQYLANNNNGNNIDIGQINLDYTITCDVSVYEQDLNVQASLDFYNDDTFGQIESDPTFNSNGDTKKKTIKQNKL